MSAPLNTSKKDVSSNSLQKLARHPLPCHLRDLVLDYLMHSCYTKTARIFASENITATPKLDADGDEIMSPPTTATSTSNKSEELSEVSLKLADLRAQIRLCILSGKVDEATALLREQVPAVLSLASRRNTGSSNDNAASTRPSDPSSSSLPTNQIEYVSSTSVQPAHVSLNLQILTFIESARTIPLPYDSSRHRNAKPNDQADEQEETNINETNADDTPPILSPMERQGRLLVKARKLHATAKMLPDPSDRSLFMQELENVAGLLAYPVPEHSEIARYFSQARRESVADQVDRAILYWKGFPVISKMELSTRYTTVLWSFLHDLHVESPLLANQPAGVHWPHNPKSEKPIDKSTTKEKEASNPSPPATAEAIPYFNLRQFLDSKT